MAIKDSIHPSSPGHWRRAPAPIDLTGVRVLLVDDDPDHLALVAELLAAANAEVTLAASAAEALQQLARSTPDVIVSDLNMPECDGYYLLRMVRARTSTPAIALTGSASTEDQTRALLAGYQVHLAKPLRIIELLVAIRNVIESSAAS